MIKTGDILRSIAEFTKQYNAGVAQRPNRMAVIDPLYTTGDPKVTFEGESQKTAKGFKCIQYTPVPGDRVIMIPVGKKDYAIVGKNGSSGPVIPSIPSPVLLTARRNTDIVVPNAGVNLPFDGEVRDTNSLWTPLSATSQPTSGSQFTGFPAGDYEITLSCAVAPVTGNLVTTFGLYILLNAVSPWAAADYALAGPEIPAQAAKNTNTCVARVTLGPSDVVTARMFNSTSAGTTVTLKKQPYYGGTQISFLKIN